MNHMEETVDLATKMMEKYLHSQGAALCDEGRVDEAISFLQQAIALEDRSYTRCDLALAFAQKKDFSRALREIDRAIILAPQITRYHYERSRLEEMRGNTSAARRDLARAIELDGNYTRIDEIREALKALEELTTDGGIIEPQSENGINDQGLRDVLARVGNGLGLPNDGLESISCALPCPAFCCHFEGSPLLHGVSIGPWKLMHIREFLRQKGLAEDQMLDRLELTGQRELHQMIPPHHVLRERGRACVYSPKKGRSLLNPALVASCPKGRAYQDMLWIHSNSWECAFLEERRCSIHDVGGESALPACKEFLCLTGFIFALLARWDLIEAHVIKDKTMEQLNGLAVEGALILSTELCQAEDLSHARASLESAVSEAVKADSRGEHEQVADLVGRIHDLSYCLDKGVAARKVSVKKLLFAMFGPIQSGRRKMSGKL